MFIKTLF